MITPKQISEFIFTPDYFDDVSYDYSTSIKQKFYYKDNIRLACEENKYNERIIYFYEDNEVYEKHHYLYDEHKNIIEVKESKYQGNSVKSIRYKVKDGLEYDRLEVEFIAGVKKSRLHTKYAQGQLTSQLFYTYRNDESIAKKATLSLDSKLNGTVTYFTVSENNQKKDYVKLNIKNGIMTSGDFFDLSMSIISGSFKQLGDCYEITYQIKEEYIVIDANYLLASVEFTKLVTVDNLDLSYVISVLVNPQYLQTLEQKSFNISYK